MQPPRVASAEAGLLPEQQAKGAIRVPCPGKQIRASHRDTEAQR
ncbi:MAG: hypothetical protein AVDCRST_MAG68-5739 [uncultured Gemmatimonadetes bacterium]|uniref:Uncharacterized protein n=1 Tax=uncultured Gemmatimonadota bacterium TaxID=203437 RepID=A0A6J4MWI2_9BACT|nr:MAG: hypothetical protein AVDCRST_MAG68-5739 [uncultured Gemmatimonadota bacterium]